MIPLLTWLAVTPAVWSAPSPSDRRLNPEQLREGLRERGLIELLEYHLRQTPPADEIEAALLRRDVLLSINADQTRSPEQRRRALNDATDILRSLIAAHAEDDRALSWRLELGKALLYDLGEPLSVRVLYRRAGPGDRDELAELMSEAVQAFDALLGLLTVEFDRLDNLSLAEYERLERSGHIERVEQLEPQATYMRRWAVFYRAIARASDDPERVTELRSVVADLRDNTSLLTEPHETTHAQAQSLLLSGMCARRLADHSLALEQLTEAVDVIERLPDDAERQSLHWAATLARVERIRALRDARRYEQAAKAVAEFRRWIATTAPDNFGYKLVAALLEGSIAREQARRAAAAGDSKLAERLRADALAPLVLLADQSDSYRDAVYADVYETLGPDPDLDALHPFERSALMAGLLRETELLQTAPSQADVPGEQVAARQRELLDRTIAVGEQTLERFGSLDARIHAEILYNLAVARYRRGYPLEAARTFAHVVERFPEFRWGESAASWAVQIAAELYNSADLQSQPDVRDLYLRALALLTDGFPKSKEARYWQYFRAQTLDNLGRYQEAAEQYARVGADQEYFGLSRFAQVRCLAQALSQGVDAGAIDPADLVRKASTIWRTGDRLLEDAAAGRVGLPSEVEADTLIAQTRLLEAEIAVLPGAERFRQALETLDGFETQHPAATELIGRVLRVRIIAYEGLGWLDRAEQEIPRYVQSDPERAGATLQALFTSITREIEKLRDAGNTDEAARKTRSALLLAEQINAWADRPDSGVPPADRPGLTLQLAEACLAAGELDRALRLFQDLHDADTSPDLTARTILGSAETLFRLQRFGEALPLYNQLYRQAPRDSQPWWKALLGDLRCRTELDEPPQDIIKVIEQHRFLYRSRLGGPRLEKEFEWLLQRNRQRRPVGP